MFTSGQTVSNAALLATAFEQCCSGQVCATGDDVGASVGALDGLDVGLIGDGVGEPVGFYMPEKKNVTIVLPSS